MQDEDEQEIDEQTSLNTLAAQCTNIVDAKYVIQKLLNLVVEKGVESAKAQYDKKELSARIQQLQKEYEQANQLILLTGDPDVHEVMEARKQERKSASPEDRFVPYSTFLKNELSSSKTNIAVPSGSDKARRRTATTDELLGTSLMLGAKEVAQNLRPIPETASTSDSAGDEMKKSSNSSNMGDEEDLSSQADAPLTSRGSSSRQRVAQITAFNSYVPSSARSERGTPENFRNRFLCRTHTAEGHQRHVNCVHATETHLMSGSRDRTAKYWDLEKCQIVLDLKSHLNHVNFVRILPEERHLAITGSLYVAKVWDLRSGECVKHMNSSGLVEEGSNERVARENKVPASEALMYTCAVDDSNKYMFTTCRNDVRVWNLDTFSSVLLLSGNHSDEVSCLAISQQHNNIIRLAAGSRDFKVGIYDFNPLTHAAQSRGVLSPPHKSLVTAALCYKDSLFTASRDKDVMHFSLRDFKRDHIENDAHNKPVAGMCLIRPLSDHPHQSVYLTTASREGSLKFWDITSSNRMRLADSIYNAHSKGINGVCANSQLVFTASDDETVGFWQIQ
ncbi:kinesin-like protein KIF21A [Ditylenchus destructor]|uniref:Kinesin-like protein KIF21A n=1 Tax=Ditylenchus destructor TaxID=166010 RepID=A0AAD4R495_9BILA|nr:kinesin-like protein KIF21A [Ditylenchus destructor]